MAASGVEAAYRGRVLVLTLGNAPSNALTAELCAALCLALEQRRADCTAVVLTGRGPNFSSHLPLESGAADPELPALCAAVAGAGVPVVAALQGLAMGPGAELALAATARIGAADCRIAFAEVALGLCSAAGSTARLPRLIGADAALRLMLSGRVLRAEEARALGLLDGIADADLIAAAVTMAEGLAGGLVLPRRVEGAQAWQAAVAAARRAALGGRPAAHRIIDCVEAALLLPDAAAAAFEAVARADLEATPEAAALQAAARAERRVAELPAAIARAEARPLTALGLVGAGAALVVLARAALGQDVPVRWLQAPAQGLAAALGLPDSATARLQLVDDAAALADLAVQIHAQPPAPGLPRPGAGAALMVLEGGEPEMGLSLAPERRFCELSVAAEEAAPSAATGLAALRRLGFLPLLVGRRPGLGRKVLRAGERALTRLAASGVPQHKIAALLSPLGLPMPKLPADLPAIREMAEPEIGNRWLGAMAAEGLSLLDQGVARRPCDIDLALVAGHGFPRWLCGPMHQADRRGLMVLRHDLRAWAAEDPVWTPPPRLDRLIQDGLRLSALNGPP